MEIRIDLQQMLEETLKAMPSDPEERLLFFEKRRKEREIRKLERLERSIREAAESYAKRASLEQLIQAERQRLDL